MLRIKWLYALFILIPGWQLLAQDMLISTDSTEIPDVELGEILISASRNDSKLKNIPSAITSIAPKQIENNQILSLEDINAYVPNFVMLNYGTKMTSPVYIRGIGSKKGNPGVGLYVDGIPYFDFSAFNFDFYDIAKLEVLRGPQGTLYGRNSMGGLININTLSPLDYQGTKARLASGTYGVRNVTLSHYGRSGNRFAYSLAGNYRYQRGYFTNIYDGSKADKLNSFGLRNRLIYNFNNNLSIENIASYEHSKQNGYPFGLYVDSTQSINDVCYNQESSYKRDMFNDGLKLKYNTATWQADLTLSYQNIIDKQSIDQDFTYDSTYYVVQEQNQNLFSTEGIIRSKNNNDYNWLFGAFAYKQNLVKNTATNIYKYNYTYLKDYDMNVNSLGIFHQSTIDLTNNLHITAGIRYNYEKTLLDYKYDLQKGSTTIPRVDSLYPALKEHILLPKLAFCYTLDDVTFYASYATGYKPGGFNSTFERDDDLQYQKEMSHNFEIGTKWSLIDGLVYSDIALFKSYLKGQQITRTVSSGQGTYLDNAGKSQNTGFELSVSTLPLKGFEATLSLGYTHSEIIKYEENDSVNHNGNTAPYIPKHTMSLMLAKTFEFHNEGALSSIRLQADFQHFGESYWQIENTYKQTQYGIFNAMISFDLNLIRLDFWAKNLFDTTYNSYMVELSNGNKFYQKGTPQRFGATVSIEI